MNPDLQLLQPYPFQKLAKLFGEVTPNAALKPISLHIGEPKHATPQFIRDALVAGLDGLAKYPTTTGSDALRTTIANWLAGRYGIPAPDAKTQVLPVNGSREALFAFAQTVIDRSKKDPVVVCPNPFYQIYEGAALLSGATPYFLNTLPEDNYALNFAQLPEEIWQRTQLIYVCSPGNPNGRVMPLAEWKSLFEMSDRYGFVIAADECYSEIYFGENKPLGALQAAQLLGRKDYNNLVVFSSLSKRSNVPGLRSGFVAGDAGILEKFALYRTYHGCAMNPAIQSASIAAWNDESHVEENRRLYAEKFSQGHGPACPGVAAYPSRMRDFTCGSERLFPTQLSRNCCTATIMSPYCPAASLPVKRAGSTRVRISSVWRWSPVWTRHWKLQDVSPNSPKN